MNTYEQEEMDEVVRQYHAAEEQSFKALFAAVDGDFSVEKPDPLPYVIWDKGLKRWGMRFSEREYEINEARRKGDGSEV